MSPRLIPADPPATHAYVAYRPCGHPVALCVDEQNTKEERKAVAKFVREQITSGYTVQRVTLDEARTIGIKYCQCPRGRPSPL